MSRINDALKESSGERSNGNARNEKERPVRPGRAKPFHFAPLYWFIGVGIIVTVFLAFNHTDEQNAIPLSEIFPDEETMPVDVEYIFVQEGLREETKVVKKPAAEKLQKVTEDIAEETMEAVPIREREVTRIEEPQKDRLASVDFNNIPYTIQIASFRDKTKAEKVLKEAQSKKYSAYLVSKDVKELGLWHRIYVGNFDSKTQAQQLLTVLSKDYAGSFVIAPKNQ